MKTLVLTIAVGDRYDKMCELTHASIEQYAKRIGADFKAIRESSLTSPHWEKFQIFDLLNIYERIIYIDTDILIREDCPSLFEVVPKHQIGMFNEMPFTSQRNLSLIETCKAYGEVLPSWNGKYYNTGVLVVSRCHKYLFKKPEKELFNFYEQGYLNMVIALQNSKVREAPLMFDLPYEFNRMTCMDQFTGEERFSSFIIHYAGYPSLNFVLELIEKDKRVWATARGKYKYKRHVLFDIQGGLGDQICAEPAIRFAKRHVWPNQDLQIKTHFPEIFKHLGLKVFTHDEFKRKYDIPLYHICSLPGPETVMWSCVSNLMCNTVDYCSMALLRRILPDADKELYLKVEEKDCEEVARILGFSDFENLVIVHPGRHWESKTFPVEWWNELVAGLAKEGLRICIFGQEEITRGTLDITIPEGVLDIRNLLNINGLFALISKAKILVTNDSSPLHIGGAFDNHIILVPTCKHPDHLFHLRKGSRSYKSIAMYKRLVADDFESAPTTVHGSSGEFIIKDYKEYLPEPMDVISEVKKRWE